MFTRNLVIFVVSPQPSVGFNCFHGGCFKVTVFCLSGFYEVLSGLENTIEFKGWERYRLSFGIYLGHLDRVFKNTRLSLG